MFVLDYSTRKDSAVIAASGATGVLRYISHTPAKDLSPDEAVALGNAGLLIGLVFETTAARATQGTQAGVDDANFSAIRLAELGFPKTKVVYVVIQDQAGMTWAQVKPYVSGWGLVMDITLDQAWGVYGGYDIVSAAKNAYPHIDVWQTSGWSHNAKMEGLTLYQDANHPSPVPDTDWNELLDPTSLWNPNGEADHAKEDDMPNMLLLNATTAGTWLFCPNTSEYLYVPSPADVDVWKALGAIEAPGFPPISDRMHSELLDAWNALKDSPKTASVSGTLNLTPQ